LEAIRNPSPIGLYFSRLWYHERLYPLIWALEALAVEDATQHRLSVCFLPCIPTRRYV